MQHRSDDRPFSPRTDRSAQRAPGPPDGCGVPPPGLWLPAAQEGPLAPSAAPTLPPGRAAQYVRMSTDHQQYSTANQRDAVARYARRHNLQVVRTYADEGKSGLALANRPGLLALLGDVTTGRADFDTVLVYDVSRWGRFQDCDESAFYEFLCRSAGIAVHYCAEAFSNDGSPASSVLKHLKRIMAAEYSRDLSRKVFEGKCRLTRLGFRTGGSAGFGLRRMVVDASGRPLKVLRDGEHKYLMTDRIVLVPGPAAELATVRWIFRQVADRSAKPLAIARALNARGVAAPGRSERWTVPRVEYMLSNEKYIGNLVWARTAGKLKGPRTRVPREAWMRVDGAFEPVVDPVLFARAQLAMARWSTRLGEAEALELLKDLLDRRGTLTAVLIDEAEGLPGSRYYADRFGGLSGAYKRIGYRPKRELGFLEAHGPRRARLRALRERVAAELARRGAAVRAESSRVWVVNERIRLAALLAYCRPAGTSPRCVAQIHLDRQPDWVLIGRMDEANARVAEHWLVAGGPHGFELGVVHRKRRQWYGPSELGPLLDRIAAGDLYPYTCGGPGSPARFWLSLRALLHQRRAAHRPV